MSIMHRRVASCLPIAAVLACAGCGEGAAPPGPVDRVELSAPSVELVPLQVRTLTAVPRDASGRVVPGRTIAWTSRDPMVATVSATGEVTGAALGVTAVVATVDGKEGEAAIQVIATLPAHLAGAWRMYSFDDKVVPAAYAIYYDEPVGDEIIAKVEIRLDSARLVLREDGIYPFRQYCFTELHDDVRRFRYCWGDHGRFDLGPARGRIAFTSEYIQNLFADGEVTPAGELALSEPLWTQEAPRATVWKRR